MKRKVGYLPFAAAPHLRRLAEHVVTAHNAVHRFDRFAPDLLETGPAALAGVRRGQQLYVFGFGRAGDTTLCGDDDDCLDADAIARRLRADGLTTDVRKVKVWASYSGVAGADSAAAALKRAMVAHGFPHVTVYGYTKALGDFVREGHKVAADVDDLGHAVATYAAKSVRVRF